MLDLIARGEGTSGPDGDNTTYGYGRYWPRGGPRLTDMTLDEVADYQGRMRTAGSSSTAVGRYQTTRATLDDFRKRMGLRGDERFTPELQDRFGRELLRDEGFDDHLSGRKAASELQQSIARRWDSISRMDGHSRSDTNKTRTLAISSQEFRRALEQSARYRNHATCSRFLFSHRFCGKPVPTFPHDALVVAVVEARQPSAPTR